jgi:hypothetical protein
MSRFRRSVTVRWVPMAAGAVQGIGAGQRCFSRFPLFLSFSP